VATTLLRPDPTFYPSARMASEAPAETLAYMVTFDPTAKTPDALVALDVNPKSPGFGKQAGRVRRPTWATSFTTSAGTSAAQLCAHTRRIPTSNVATCWSRAFARRGSMSSTSSGIQNSRSSSTRSRPRRSRTAPGTAGRTPFTAVRMESTLAPSARPTETRLAEFSSSTTTPSL
jgi:hypothetical protein